jgi:hypothetical protein
MRDDNTDQPPMRPPVEVPRPLADPLDCIEAKLLRSLWLVISSFNDPSMTTVNTLGGYTAHGAFGEHINEISVLFDEYREQLEHMRTNLIEAAREVDAGTRCINDIFEARYRGPAHPINGLCVKRSIIRSILFATELAMNLSVL